MTLPILEMLRLISSPRLAIASPAIAPFTVFQTTGMLMARPIPLQYTESPDASPPTIAREGYIRLTMIPRDSEGGFDKEKKISLNLKPKQIGQLIAWKSFKNPISINAWTGVVDMKPKGDEIEITVTSTPKGETAPTETTPVTVSLELGEVKSLQILLESALPHLYGWVGVNTIPKKSTWTKLTDSPKSPEDFFNQFKQ
jgi:hypothetical protein